MVRRISGGGAVYHDLNNLNYTIISKEDRNRAFDLRASRLVINMAQLGVKASYRVVTIWKLMVRNSVEITSLYQWTYHAPWLPSL